MNYYNLNRFRAPRCMPHMALPLTTGLAVINHPARTQGPTMNHIPYEWRDKTQDRRPLLCNH